MIAKTRKMSVQRYVCDIFIYCLTVGVGCSIALKLVDSNIAFTHRQFIESVKKGFSKVFKYMGIQAMILLYCIPSLLLAVGGISCVANNPDGYLLFTLGVLMLIGAFLSFYYLLISYAFSNFIILDKNTGVFKSLKSSKELVKKDFLKSIAIFFGFGLISVLNIAAFVFLTVAPLSLGMSFIPFSGEVWFAVVAVIIAIAFVVLVIVEVLLLLGVTNFYKQMQHKHGSSFEQADPSF